MRWMGGIAVLLAIMAMPVEAQRPGAMRGPDAMSRFGDRADARDVLADEMIRLRERLDLSDDQVERIKEAQEADRATRDDMRLELRELRDQLRDEEITREEFRAELDALRTTTMDDVEAYRETLESVLTDEQLSQMQSLRRQTMRRRGLARMRVRQRAAPTRGPRPFGPRGGFGPRQRG